MKTIRISAKCSDLFAALLCDGDKIIGEYGGYVPAWLPNLQTEHYGDYVTLEIDIETGKIIGWKKPTQAQLKETFKKS
jgi:hypothetical protein